MVGRPRMLGAAIVVLFVGAAASACLGYSAIDEESNAGVDLPARESRREGGTAEATAPDGPALDAGAQPSVDAAPEAGGPLRAFVSSALKNGNLGGLAGADALCTTLAAAKFGGGTYKAWLSVPGTNAIDRITSAGPWQLVTGEVVADNKAGLTTGQLKTLLNKDENGASLPDAEDRVWTATAANGTYSGPDCSLWAGGGDGRVGEANNNGNSAWTNLGNEACGQVNRIYCFEQ